MNGTVKTVAVRENMSMRDVHKELLQKMGRGLNPEVKTLMETTCAEYDFFARHAATRTISKVLSLFSHFSFYFCSSI
jgi:lauroyl/myristoyl acyltransferase